LVLLQLQKYLLKQKFKNFKLAAVCIKHNLLLLKENRPDSVDAGLSIVFRMGTLLGSCNEFELMCDEYSEAIEWAEQRKATTLERYCSLLNSLGLAYKTTRQYNKARKCYNKALAVMKNSRNVELIKRNLHLLDDAEKTSKLGIALAEEHLRLDRIRQIEGHLHDLGVLKKESNVNSCAACHQTSKSCKTCGACKRVYYCNQQCQKSHWTEHKPLCTIAKK